MTIDKTGSFYCLTCDNCGQVFDEEFDNFDEEFDAALAKQQAKQEQPDFDIKPIETTGMNIYIQSMALSAASLASAVVKDPLALALVKKYLGVGA